MDKVELIEEAISRGVKYDKDTGIITGISGRVINRKSKGYIDIAIIVGSKTMHLPGHQFAFYYVNKYLPSIIDHVDRDRSNNKIDNLRPATKLQNNRNTTGKGYYFHKQVRKYNAQLTHNYKHISLGLYDTEEEASEAYRQAKIKFGHV
jgi:hypothetical protein